MASPRTALARVYGRFGEIDAAGTLYERVAVAISESDEALRVIESAPPTKRGPERILSALHDLALAGEAPALAQAFDADDGDVASWAALDIVTRKAESVVALAASKNVRSDQTGRHAVLYPAIAEVARRTGAGSVGLIDIGTGLNLTVDRVRIAYSDGLSLGDRSSGVTVSARVVGDRQIPSTDIPAVVARICIDRDPLDVTDPDDVRWMRACVWPDQRDKRAALDAEIALLASDPPALLRGDVVELLPDAVARVPVDALPVVITTWALSKLSPARRRAFVDRLSGVERPVAWVSPEGVGVAPSVPTLGDRPASGHSIIGSVVFDGVGVSAEALGRCWSRGKILSWLG